MKVLHVITGLDVGGAEIQLAMLLKYSRHDCEVVTLYNPGPVADQIRASGVSVRDLAMHRNTSLSALPRLRSIMAAGRYDVVHAHLYRSQVYARPAAKLAGVPVVVTTEHSIGDTHIERRKMTNGVRGLYLASEFFSDATIAVSDVVRERLVNWGVRERKITVVPNGLDTDALAFDQVAREHVRAQFGIPADTYVIGLLGRLDPNKRIDLAIESAVPVLGPSCKVLVIGRGADLARIEAAVARLGVGEHVIFGGFQQDTAAMMSAFDLYLATSLQETFGLSVLEAIANGLPVLYTTCPALDGITTGQARQVAGTVEALGAEIRKAVEAGPQPREPDGAVFQRYGMASVAGQIDDLYERIMAGRRSGWHRRSGLGTARL
ncbi:MAG TPA: glycosyltransferase [Streptosporangiaceae bacterium]